MSPSMKHGIFLAVLAAGLYALSSPFSKLLLPFMPSTLVAGFLYLGAGLGMTALALSRKAAGRPEAEAHLTRKELPYTIGGGIGQSRLCLFFLRKAHIGEVQVSLWPDEDLKYAADHDVTLL